MDNISLTEVETCQVGCDICRGLQYLHSINIVHRDLKSKNVLLTGSPPVCQAKLRLWNGQNETGVCYHDWYVCCSPTPQISGYSCSGNVGTVHWTAPEVMASQRYQFPADVYSLGMVMYEMVTGHIPFQELIPMAVMMAVAINKKQPDIPPLVLPAMAALIRR